MSRTIRNRDKFSEVLRTSEPYARIQRRALLKAFEKEYRSHNDNPLIEL
jgi:hypothetical protein